MEFGDMMNKLLRAIDRNDPWSASDLISWVEAHYPSFVADAEKPELKIAEFVEAVAAKVKDDPANRLIGLSLRIIANECRLISMHRDLDMTSSRNQESGGDMADPAVMKLIELLNECADNFILLQEQAEIIERDRTVSPVIRQACADMRVGLDHAYGKARFLMSLNEDGSGSSVTDL